MNTSCLSRRQRDAVQYVICTYLEKRYVVSDSPVQQYCLPVAKFRIEAMDAILDCLTEEQLSEDNTLKSCENCANFAAFAELIGLENSGSLCKNCTGFDFWEHAVNLRNDLATAALRPLSPDDFIPNRIIPDWTVMYTGDSKLGMLYWYTR